MSKLRKKEFTATKIVTVFANKLIAREHHIFILETFLRLNGMHLWSILLMGHDLERHTFLHRVPEVKRNCRLLRQDRLKA